MARVSHKKIKQLIAQKQKTITDRQFFTSRAFATYFADIAAAQTRRYGYQRRVKVKVVWKPTDPESAHTDNARIWINAGHTSVTCCRSRPERYEQVCGLFAHELGHILYTDFLTLQTYHSYQASARWYPGEPLMRDAIERHAGAEYMDMLLNDPVSQKLLAYITHEILNVLEDGYIEQRMLMAYPGILGCNLEIMRNADYEAMLTLSQMVESESDAGHIWMTILQNICSYMKWGKIKYGETPLTDERVQVVFSMLGELDNALVSRDFRDRCRTANLILIRCWNYIVDFIDYCKDRAQKQAESGGTGDAGIIVTQLLSSLVGGSSEGTGETAPVADDPSTAVSSGAPTAKQRAATAKLAEAAGEQEESQEESQEEPSEGPPVESSEDVGSAVEIPDSSQDEDTDVQEDVGNGLIPSLDVSHSVSSEQEDRLPLCDTDTTFTPEGGGVEWDNAYQGTGYVNAASDIERILEDAAEQAVCGKLERQRTKELTELAQSISYGNIHAGVPITVHRMAEVSDEMKEQYQEISGELLHISKQLQKSVLRQLQDSRRGGKQVGLLLGPRLDTHALFRNDGRVFYKNALPNEVPALSVGLLLDESGSMSWNDRATYARATAIILYDFCQALGIPIMIYGHSTKNGVALYSYAEFDAIDRDDKYRLLDISARNGNRDGAALRYVAEQLSHRPEDIKLLMLVSDGQPADLGYMGTAAEEDLRGIKQEYQRKKVLFVAAAIGSDKENIERIYGDSFLDITDLNKLPVKLAGIIKRFIRV